MWDGHSQRRGNSPDSLDEFLAQLLSDVPDVPPNPTTYTLSHPSCSASTTTNPYHTPDPYPACQWVSSSNPPVICGALLSQDTKLICEHFRHVHDVRGNEKVHVGCRWYDCKVAPMLRGSLVRHILTVHLNLLKWECEACGKVFSRKGTGHTCVVNK